MEELVRKPDFYIVTPRIPRQRPGIPNDITRLTNLAEELGYDRAWIIETNDRDAFSLATQMVLSSGRIKVGTNIVSVFTRTPTLIAMGAFTLDELSGHRFILGIGPGGTEIVTDGHGISFRDPVERVRETIDVVKGLIGGNRLDYNGKIFKVRNFKLRVGSEKPDMPVFNSGLNPRMLRLGGEKSDGVILSHMPIEAAEDVKRIVAEGARSAGRDPDRVEICSNLPLGVNRGDGPTNLRKAVAWHLAARTYDWLISHTPYGDVVAKMRELWWSGRREEAAQLMSDDVLTTFGLGYTEEQIRERIRKYIDAGITPIIDAHGIRKGHEFEDTAELMKIAIGS